MHRLFPAFLAVAAFVAAAPLPNEPPYCENAVVPVHFDPQGTWTLTGVAAESQSASLIRLRRMHLVGAQLLIKGRQVEFRTKNGGWVEPFAAPVLGQQSYDTRSREFWLDFFTPADKLKLPRYVGAVNLEFGTVLAAGNNRFFFEYNGVWFTIARTGQGNA